MTITSTSAPQSMLTLSERLAKWTAAQTYEKLPTETVHEVKRRTIDVLGTALGGYHAYPCKVARAKAASVHDTRAATIWGTTHSTEPELAAFANGAMVRYLDFNDTYTSQEYAHPSDNIPAAVAVAQSAGKGGKDAILGIVIGYEIQCRLCDAASLRSKGWDHVIYGSLSTALAGAKLWDLDLHGLLQAVSLAGICNAATRQTRIGQLSMWRALAFGNAARNGVFAADIARRGIRGPNETLQGPRGLANQLGIPELRDTLVLPTEADYLIHRTHLKKWPAGFFALSAIDAALQLRDQVDIKEITSIEIRSFEAAVDTMGCEPEKWCPTSRSTATHSLAYCTAVALVDGLVEAQSFLAPRLKDPWVIGLLEKTKVVHDPDLDDAYPEGTPTVVTITLSNGKSVQKRVDYPRGHAGNPMSDDELVRKYQALAEGVVSKDVADRILDRAWHLEELDDLWDLFAFPTL